MRNAKEDARPYTIVAALDFGPSSEEVLRQSLQMAAAHRGGELHVLHVFDDDGGSGPLRAPRIARQNVMLEELPQRMRDYVQQVAGEVPELGNTRLGVHVRIGKPPEAITQMAVDTRADVIVTGTHGREGLERVVLGSVAEWLVRHAPCPVVVARARDYSGLQPTEGISPPCPDCLQARRESGGERWWCERHERDQRETHVYSGMAPVHWTAGSADVYGPTAASRL
ncbi:MAG: universal stress protein [Myxococcales bacterium]|jgi:universal stress protein A